MRQFKGLLFLGAGPYSDAQCSLLKMSLETGLSISSALQQGLRSETAEHELEDIVRDIAAALLGRDIEITDELPYPWTLDTNDHQEKGTENG